MRSDSRLSRMLHVLIHMQGSDGPLTSEMIARMLGTNPVVVRRTMAGLRDQGYVASVKGHGGGWTLARDLDQLSLLDIYRALGEPPVFALGPTEDHPRCLVEQAVNRAVDDTLREAQALIHERFAAVSVGDLAREFHQLARQYRVDLGRAAETG